MRHFLTIVILALVCGCAVPSDAQIQFVWSGAVTDSSATVRAKLTSDGAVARLAVSLNVDMGAPLYSDPDTADLAVNNKVVTLLITGLAADTVYCYMIEIDGVLDAAVQGRFRTFPAQGPASFRFAFASCASTGSSHAVFATIESLDPLFFMHTGDFHYQNIAVNDPAVFRAAYETVLASPRQSSLYRHVPIAYIWDDHDYGPNNSDSTAPGRLAARLTYQEYVPHYPLEAGVGDVPIYQTFTVGRVKFIVTDSRSARSPASATDNAAKTMLGTTQKAWFKQELLDANGVYPLIVWVNSLPWIGIAGDDGWHLYTNERREIADFIKGNGIRGLCMISGDAHMLAIDDGTHSDYATGGGASFPVMHAAALDRGGSVKGGPYSEGAYPGTGQFGLMTVTDTGGPYIDVAWSGRNYRNTEVVSYAFSVFAGYGESCDCSRHGDIRDDDGLFTSLDVDQLIDYLFAGVAQPPTDPTCPHIDRADVNCDGFDDALDLSCYIDLVFFRGPSPCNPCACAPYPSSCH